MYRIVRHPMYGGGLVLAFGWALASSPMAVAPVAALAVLFELKSRREEAWLVERYPDYPAYRRRTRWKFVPGLR
jgi:protein-S-isoprenylcysteine O-methyltransferase Ste14